MKNKEQEHQYTLQELDDAIGDDDDDEDGPEWYFLDRDVRPFLFHLSINLNKCIYLYLFIFIFMCVYIHIYGSF